MGSPMASVLTPPPRETAGIVRVEEELTFGGLKSEAGSKISTPASASTSPWLSAIFKNRD